MLWPMIVLWVSSQQAINLQHLMVEYKYKGIDGFTVELHFLFLFEMHLWLGRVEENRIQLVSNVAIVVVEDFCYWNREISHLN